MSDQTRKTMHPLIPLAVLEALRAQDVPEPDGLDEFHVEFTTKRLGMSHTVERQIDRYRALMSEGGRVSRDEVVALFRLASRRPDADWLFTEAGRRAGVMAAAQARDARGAFKRVVPGFVRRRVEWRSARRGLRRFFDLSLARKPDGFVLDGGTAFTAEAVSDGSACGFLGAAAAAVLRVNTGFEGAVVHERCRAKGADSCRWEAAGFERCDER